MRLTPVESSELVALALQFVIKQRSSFEHYLKDEGYSNLVPRIHHLDAIRCQHQQKILKGPRS